MNREVKSGLFEILSKIKAKPGLYIGHPSVSDLFIFLAGYKTARRELEIKPTEKEMRFYQEFHSFVEQKYNLHTSNTWAKIILLYCSDEKQGFERFFELLAQFEQLQSQETQADGSTEKEATVSFKGYRKVSTTIPSITSPSQSPSKVKPRKFLGSTDSREIFHTQNPGEPS